VYGARPLKRLIQRRLQDPIAMAILEGRVREGDTVTVEADGDALVIGGGGSAAAGGVVDAEVVEA
jgi:ATP-dependent Clp protease ATP-binding subunit ClpB